MLDIHITEFYNDMARILVTLYRQFPRQVSVYIEDVSGADTPDDYGLHSERHMACFSTVLWMEQEGLIRFGDMERQLAFNHCTLTLLTFRKLSGFDQKLEGPPLIDELRVALNEGSSDRTEEVLKRLLGGV